MNILLFNIVATVLLACVLLAYCQSTCVCVGVSATLMLNISKTKRFRGSCSIGRLRKVPAYGASIGDVMSSMTSRDYDVIHMT